MSPQLAWWLGWTLPLLAVCLVALIRGQRDERLAALALLAAHVATTVADREAVWTAAHRASVAAVDAALLVSLVLIGLRSNRWWPMAAAACWLDSILMLGALVVAPGLRNSVFWLGSLVLSYGVLLAVGVGAVLEGRRPVGTLDFLRRPVRHR